MSSVTAASYFTNKPSLILFQISDTNFALGYVYFPEEVNAKYNVDDFSDINFVYHKLHLSLNEDEGFTKDMLCKQRNTVETNGLYHMLSVFNLF